MQSPPPPPRPPESLSFNASSAVPIAGAASGAIIAVGAPWVLLANGQALGTGVLTGLIIFALCIGGVVSLASAVLGLVMPRHIDRSWADPERWQKWRAFKREMESDAMRGWAKRGRKRGGDED